VQTLAAASRSPVHAYVFVGPPGSGRFQAARAFAAALLCPSGGCGECSDCRRAVAGAHPDLVVVERAGASITVGDAADITRLALRSPVEGRRKVLVLTEFHLVSRAAPALLKTIEEPPPSTVFVIIADHVSPELVTIASRCVAVAFGPLSPDVVSEVLESEGTDADTAAAVAQAAGGRLDRARLLVRDPGFSARRTEWMAVPESLDGTGATVARLVDGLLAGIDAAVEPLKAVQAEEVAAAAAEAKSRGERGMAREMEDRHRREQRRVRTDEIRAGLAALVEAYRRRLDAPAAGRAGAAIRCIAAVEEAAQALLRNPNEALLLQSLLIRLDDAAR